MSIPYQNKHHNLEDIPLNERPREKLYHKGLSSLCDVELLALALGKGSKKLGVMELSAKVLECINQSGSLDCIDELQKVHGIGKARAGALISAFAFASRRLLPKSQQVKHAEDVYHLVRYLAEEKQEHLLCISLNGEHVPHAVRVVTRGLVNKTQIHPREVFSDPISDRAAAIIIAHNHPSGSLSPSKADIEVTKRITEAGEILGIPLLDHVVFSRLGYRSLKDEV